ncbi:DUF6896 domain-containing protein [Aquimarina algiphila]|uniref:DUF6896 domain-containing protein n=1 Tax=Aquimarina algiphila TaxID=2047982 RepID=UPI002490DAF9|nr:hypothetical protein [Aquimarina algiphila]
MEKELELYISFIKDFEKELSVKHGISDDFWNKSGKDFPKKGTTENYIYNFHGAGCTIEQNDIICEYDTAPLNGNNIKFSPWKFFNFIKTHPKLNTISKEDLESGLQLLLTKKKISKLVINDIQTGVYQVIAPAGV